MPRLDHYYDLEPCESLRWHAELCRTAALGTERKGIVQKRMLVLVTNYSFSLHSALHRFVSPEEKLPNTIKEACIQSNIRRCPAVSAITILCAKVKVSI